MGGAHRIDRNDEVCAALSWAQIEVVVATIADMGATVVVVSEGEE